MSVKSRIPRKLKKQYKQREGLISDYQTVIKLNKPNFKAKFNHYGCSTANTPNHKEYRLICVKNANNDILRIRAIDLANYPDFKPCGKQEWKVKKQNKAIVKNLESPKPQYSEHTLSKRIYKLKVENIKRIRAFDKLNQKNKFKHKSSLKRRKLRINTKRYDRISNNES